MNVRETALSLLGEYESSDKYVNLSLSSHLCDGLTAEERGFLTALLYTAVEHKITYDYYIGALAGRSPDDVTQRARNILRLGMCQILDMDNIPDFAAVNETVKLARNAGERAFVNGILRRVAREKDALPLPSREKNAARYLSVKYSFDLSIVKHFISLFGEEGAEELLISYSMPQPTDLTVNTLKISPEAYKEKLIASGYKAEIHPISKNTVRVEGSVSPRSLPGFSDGEFFVQDAACAAAVSTLAPAPNELLLDACACPGGKSFAAAVLMKNTGEIQAFDIHESKLSLISDGAVRLGIDIIKASVMDSGIPNEELFSKMDKVICDVPCSGLGVLGKKPDMRYKKLSKSDGLPSVQYSILNASAKYLKPGGVLLYSTCTLNPTENEDVVSRFLLENKEYKARPFTLGGEYWECGFMTLLPHVHKTDGFFVALIERV